MKIISLAAISLGVISMLVASIEGAIHKYLFNIHPFDFYILAQTFFLLAVALMCYERFYGSDNGQK